MTIDIDDVKRLLIRVFFGSCTVAVLCFFVGIWSEIDKFNYTGMLFVFIAIVCMAGMMAIVDLVPPPDREEEESDTDAD